jgi:hypothetical protein
MNQKQRFLAQKLNLALVPIWIALIAFTLIGFSLG